MIFQNLAFGPFALNQKISCNIVDKPTIELGTECHFFPIRVSNRKDDGVCQTPTPDRRVREYILYYMRTLLGLLLLLHATTPFSRE